MYDETYVYIYILIYTHMCDRRPRGGQLQLADGAPRPPRRLITMAKTFKLLLLMPLLLNYYYLTITFSIIIPQSCYF